MNNWNGANFWWQKWTAAMVMAKRSPSPEFWCREAVIAQMNAMCYRAQEWAGAQK